MIRISTEVLQALNQGEPIVALESTVITHGLPYPQNLRLGLDMENEVRNHGVIPAMIAALNGEVLVGLSTAQLEVLIAEKDVMKISVRDIPEVVTKGKNGGTTVAATLLLAKQAGLRVFATGGIGGVHRGGGFDISADLFQLASTPMIVVCAGAKAILDLPATLEVLETLGVPVLGYKTDEFPAFFSRSSDLPVSARVDTPEEAAEFARVHWELGMKSSVLVVQPIAEDQAIPNEEIEVAIEKAVEEAVMQGISGQKTTPYLLQRVSELTEGRSLTANLALLIQNTALASEIAKVLVI